MWDQKNFCVQGFVADILAHLLIGAVLDDTSDEESAEPFFKNLVEGGKRSCHMARGGKRSRVHDAHDAVAVTATGSVPMKRRKTVSTQNACHTTIESCTVESDDVIDDQDTCLREYDELMQKLLDTFREHKAAEDASAAAMSAVDKHSIEADRAARMELKDVTQQKEDLRREIGNLVTAR